MDATWKAIFWNQFGAAMDMFENAIRACPDEVWGNVAEKPLGKNMSAVGFWYVAYHTIFWTDYYLSENTPTEKDFVPPKPFTLSEFQDGTLPERVYSKEELLKYLDHCRRKFAGLITHWSEEKAHRSCGIQYREDMSAAELFLYNLRHVQHHAAQLNLLLRQSIDSAPDWVSRTKAKFP